jgi:hypothetical protein
MKQIKVLFLFFFLLNQMGFAQKHSITYTSGRAIVGSFTDIELDIFYLWDDTPGAERYEATHIKEMSRFKMPSTSLYYSYAIKEKLKLVAGFRANNKGYGIRTTLKYPQSGRTITYLSDIIYNHYGFILGFDHYFLLKNRVKMGWSFYLNPEMYHVTNRFTYLNLGSVIGINADIKIWRFISLRLNPYSEIGLMPYKKGYEFSQNVNTIFPYGFGYQVGLSFNIK